MSLRHTLLALLDWMPLHGYALRDYARGYAWLHPMTNANIYPTLRTLEEEGFVARLVVDECVAPAGDGGVGVNGCCDSEESYEQ